MPENGQPVLRTAVHLAPEELAAALVFFSVGPEDTGAGQLGLVPGGPVAPRRAP